jgi:hypothetical protein
VRLVTGTPAPVPTPTPLPKPSLLRQPRPMTGELALQTLYGRCFPFKERNYEYSFCPFHNITQKDVSAAWGAFYGVLGVWDDWQDNGGQATPTSQLYSDGTECGFKRRLARVHISCGGSEPRVLSVSEPSTCEYTFQFECPEACSTFVVNTTAVAQAKALAARDAPATPASSPPAVSTATTSSAIATASSAQSTTSPTSNVPQHGAVMSSAAAPSQSASCSSSPKSHGSPATTTPTPGSGSSVPAPAAALSTFSRPTDASPSVRASSAAHDSMSAAHSQAASAEAAPMTTAILSLLTSNAAALERLSLKLYSILQALESVRSHDVGTKSDESDDLAPAQSSNSSGAAPSTLATSLPGHAATMLSSDASASTLPVASAPSRTPSCHAEVPDHHAGTAEL